MAVGLFLTSAGVLVLSRADANSGYLLIASALSVIGFGMGSAMPIAMDAILGALPQGRTGAGLAITRTLQQVAVSFGVAVLGSVLNSAYRSNLNSHLTGISAKAKDIALGNVAGATGVAHHLPTGAADALLRAAHDAYASGMSEEMLVCAVVMLVGTAVVGLFLPARAVQTDQTPAEERASTELVA